MGYIVSGFNDHPELVPILTAQHGWVLLDDKGRLDAMRTAEAVSLLFILFCRDPQFLRALYKLDPVLFRRFTNGEVWL